MLIEEQLTEVIIGAAIEVHRVLEPGLLESAYGQCLCHELTLRGIHFQLQVPFRVKYKDILLDCGYRMDLVIDGRVVIEFKTVEKPVPIHEAQLLTYLRLSGVRVGVLINFNSPVLRSSIKRMVL